MGWSPAIAQALTWSILVYRELGKAEAGKDLFDTDCFKDRCGRLSFYLTLKNGKGIAFVYYDNIVVITGAPEDAIAVKRAIHYASNRLHARIKGEVTISSPAKIGEKGVDIVGVHAFHRTPEQLGKVQAWMMYSVCPRNRRSGYQTSASLLKKNQQPGRQLAPSAG